MLKPEKFQRLRFLESNLETRIFDARDWLSTPEALTHLKSGLGARHYVLRHCREYLERTCFAAKRDALSADVATEAALHLNGYYLNLRGALDNLAWILQFELQVFPGTTEDSGARMKVHLFGDKFLKAVGDRSTPHANHLSAMKSWGLDLAVLRDPAAHRIPLYVPPGIITSQDQVDEFRRLDHLSGAPESELGGKRRIEIMIEAQQVASFEPVFCVNSESGIKVYNIPKQLLFDHRHYLHLARKVLEEFK
ncbi:hypothetical protein [Marinobacter fonticola]|uniref:hypothetical protein n=1 Tax=Marinobacter fonticola TaxID=2603215 RepID=UPI0011E694FF|nr:hypothetical protein [Marinobacter fonticola]